MDFDMKMLAYCGLYCEQCSVRTAFVQQDEAHLEHFPAKFKTGRTVLSDYACEGCKGRNLCGPCAIKDCASARGVDSCADCGDFPCDRIARFGTDGIAHHRQAVANLRDIREKGIDAWFAALSPALRCRCGRRQSWYHTCPEHS